MYPLKDAHVTFDFFLCRGLGDDRKKTLRKWDYISHTGTEEFSHWKHLFFGTRYFKCSESSKPEALKKPQNSNC